MAQIQSHLQVENAEKVDHYPVSDRDSETLRNSHSSLTELQSVLQSKIDVNPNYWVLMSLPCLMQVLCMTRYTQVDHIRILVTFVHKINRQKEYCLSFARTLTSRY